VNEVRVLIKRLSTIPVAPATSHPPTQWHPPLIYSIIPRKQAL